MIFDLVPASTSFFPPLCLNAASLSVSGGTRAAGALRTHPYPLQLSGQTDHGWTTGISDKSFAFLIARIRNELSLDEAVHASLPNLSHSI